MKQSRTVACRCRVAAAGRRAAGRRGFEPIGIRLVRAIKGGRSVQSAAPLEGIHLRLDTVIATRGYDWTASAIELDDVLNRPPHLFTRAGGVAPARGIGSTDVEGRRRYLCLPADVRGGNFGHRNTEIIATAHHKSSVRIWVRRCVSAKHWGAFCGRWRSGGERPWLLR